MSNNIDQPIETFIINHCQVTLLGTAHVSKASAEAVETLISANDYDAIAVELCPSRYNALIDPDSLAKMDLFNVIKSGKAAMVTASLALGAFQQKMADELGIEPGAEMKIAADLAQQSHKPVLLIDREVGTTLKRVYRNVPWWKRMELVSGLLASVMFSEKVSEEDIEKLKEGDVLDATFSQFAESSHEIYEPLVNERDQYMAHRIVNDAKSGQYKTMLAVIGAGHLKGIKSYIDSQLKNAKSLEELDTLPPSSRWPKIIPWVIVTLVFVGFGIGFNRAPELGWQLVIEWVLINGGLSALGALLATAHPLTIITAFLAAPLTSLNPTVGAGMVTAATEAWARKPRVGDFSTLKRDTVNITGWWKNRVSRTLLVFLFSTIGSAAGTYIAGFRIFEQLT
ncbi:MAG: TraB/GumN family protein [Cycloclasticus sp.]|nr:MAG: conjugal transfer protein TraB [Cycloclasticus sp. Phe_18]MBV1913145.1 TraB/GumN family protein [Cycloclasticus sp.]MDF1689554.1 TraB/GumN family protein [Cycloclasticus sp.]MEE4290719.1 TraB/GumN family protein [Cycloclasticus sp.]